MRKCSAIFFILLLSGFCVTAQESKPVKFNKEYSNLYIKENDSNIYKFKFEKDFYYSFLAQNRGVNVSITLSDNKGNVIKSDASYHEADPAKILYSPAVSGIFTLKVKLKTDKKYPSAGNYSLLIKSAPQKLRQFSYAELTKDFDVLKNGYIETKVGLWYNSYAQFDSLCNVQRAKIKDKMTANDLYQILAPVTEYTKEGHCKIGISEESELFANQNYRYFPFIIKVIDGKVFILNDLESFKTRGLMISKINGVSIDVIMEKFLSIKPSDGYNITGKYGVIARDFYKEYANFFESQPKQFNVELVNTENNKSIVYNGIAAMPAKVFNKYRQDFYKNNPGFTFTDYSYIKIDTALSTAIMTFNDFEYSGYKGDMEGFEKLLADYFKRVSELKIKNLIIDLRKNGGGSQGAEDKLLSYLIDKAYSKYKYVELPAFRFSFAQYTQKATKKGQDDFENRLKSEFYLGKDGRYLDKKETHPGEKPKENNFKGKIYVLINGRTFSGASEFSALAKNYTNAKFIGEETGGGYYGNTSGNFLQFTLPNTGIQGRIPVFKYVIVPQENNIPYGRGVLPDYKIQPTIQEYVSGFDTELEYTKKLISENR